MTFFKRKNLFVAVIFLCGFLVNKYVITINPVQGQSMAPTLVDGSFVVSVMAPVFKLTQPNYVRGEIYILRPTGYQTKLIKRLIALPGEQVWIDNGIIFVNDKNMTDDLHLTPAKSSDALACKYFSKYTVPDNQYFFVGDNLCAASDSRNIGAIAVENILAKVISKFNL